MKSKLTRYQVQKFEKKNVRDEYKNLIDIYVIVHFDDNCGNGHNTLSVTGQTYGAGYEGDKRMISGRLIHNEILRHFPELKRAVDFHSCSTDGPMHYIANSLYHASDKDHNGLRKGEKRQIRNGATGELCWVLTTHYDGDEPPDFVCGEKPPEVKVAVSYQPLWQYGKGKKPDLEAARACAIWPDAELEDFTEEKLKARLPGLLRELKEIVENLGMEY